MVAYFLGQTLVLSIRRSLAECALISQREVDSDKVPKASPLSQRLVFRIIIPSSRAANFVTESGLARFHPHHIEETLSVLFFKTVYVLLMQPKLGSETRHTI